ncbi:DNA gyrase inhibitor YacG [Lichenifustis flavocetrariae]|uniref:DNA gyrase inhibitor YacG n=1 Tax=Lichenifustis flavocetrariae TaxID=2949735 RepID=UPI003D0F4012
MGHARCPICRRPSDPVLRPFCSKRCADVDLHRWLSGAYAVPAEETEDDEAAVDDSGEPEAKKS